jgi:glycerophosphoryl diester phosphodiesterase
MGFEIVAHRGASGDAPENTLAAIRLAWAQQADAAEIDVRLTADGQIVAFHDPRTLRTTGDDLAIAKTTLADLKTLDAGLWKGEEWIGERIPTLTEVLAAVPDGKRLFVEIKCGKEIIPEFLRILNQTQTTERVVAIGYGFNVLAELKRQHPEVTALQVLRLCKNPKTQQEGSTTLAEWIEPVKNAGLDGFDLGIAQLLSESVSRNLIAQGFQLAAWTINDPAEARRLREIGVTSITTDLPGHLRQELALPNQDQPAPVAMGEG